jgi:hypothetical protein
VREGSQPQRPMGRLEAGAAWHAFKMFQTGLLSSAPKRYACQQLPTSRNSLRLSLRRSEAALAASCARKSITSSLR